jgi:hypothetical protein
MSIAVAPKELPLAPRPISTEVLSSWLLRIAAANLVSLQELLQGFESHYGRVLTNVPIDYSLSPAAVAALSRFCRVAPETIRRLDLRQRAPYLHPALLLRFQNADSFCPRYSLHRVRYAFCPLCITEQQIIHVRWDWTIACLIRCTVHRAPLLDECPACGDADPLMFPEPDSSASRLCRSCGSALHGFAHSPKSIQREEDVRAVEDAYRAALLGVAPVLLSKTTDRAFRQFVQDMLQLLTRCLTPRPTCRSTGSPFSRQDMLEMIAALILNAVPSSDRSVRCKRYACGLRLWSTLLSIVPDYEGATIEQASARWPVALRRRFLSALYYRIRKRWPFTPYRSAKYFAKPVERTEIASVYGLTVTSTNCQSKLRDPLAS